jgi:hypothetical protein
MPEDLHHHTKRDAFSQHRGGRRVAQIVETLTWQARDARGWTGTGPTNRSKTTITKQLPPFSKSTVYSLQRHKSQIPYLRTAPPRVRESRFVAV